MWCDKVTAELRADGTVVLIIPDEERIDILSAFSVGATCSRFISDNQKLRKDPRDTALEVAECLERLEEMIEQLFGGQAPERPTLRLV